MTKKRAKAKPKEEPAVQTELEEILGTEEPQETPVEEPEEPKPDEKPAEEPTPDEEYTEEPEPSEEPTEELSEEEKEKLAAEAREKEERDREKGLKEELTRYRETIRRLRAEKEALVRTPQAPIPGQMPTAEQTQFQPYGQPMPGQPGPQQQTTPVFQVPVSFDGDTPSVDLAPLFSAYEARFQQHLEQAMRPDPVKAEQAAIADARTKWIGVDPEQAPARNQAAQRMEQASDLLAEKFDEYTMRTGVQPKGFQQVVDLIDSSEIGDTLKTYFPEVQDTASFVDAFFMPVTDPSVRIWKLRSYMDRYMSTQSQQQQQNLEPEPEPDNEPTPSNVVRIPDKPRSMATKGQGAAAASTDKQRFMQLGDDIGKEVFVPDDKYKEYQRLGKKLGIEGF